MSSAPQDDAQRELEQRALRNVRGLVDKMEDLEAHDSRTQRRYLLAIVVGGALVCVVLAGMLWYFAHRGPAAGGQLIDVAKPAPPAAAKP
jgi:hypothetical protein